MRAEPRLRPLCGLACALVALVLAPGAATALQRSADQVERSSEPRGEARPDVIEGSYIVTLSDEARRPGTMASRLERALGFATSHRYRSALRGFAARLSPGQARALRDNPRVEGIGRDLRVTTTAEVPLASGEETPPPGIRRILAATEVTARQASDAAVAVLDTGIDLQHPDLNAVHGRNCIDDSAPALDGDGHGTHVAGTIAARNQGQGVVGVAPGTKLHSVKVLDDNGNGSTSQVICGIDWVTTNAEARGIGVANMSLGAESPHPLGSCPTTADPMHRAICESTDAGINYVVAAGNEERDFDHPSAPDVPAAYPEVLTVTAMTDTDGLPGGLGPVPGCASGETDDHFAWFTNFALTAAGRAHTIAAPGTCIRSTVPGGGHGAKSGTSMAAPHVAGVVALCINEAGADGPCASMDPAEVVEHVRADAESFSNADPGYGFHGDPLDPFPGDDGYQGYLVRTPPAPALVAPSLDSAPAIAGVAEAGRTLTATPGTWSGTKPIQTSIAWQRCDAGGSGCVTIPGASASSYAMGDADAGSRLRVRVSASNVAGSSVATSAPSALVAPDPRIERARLHSECLQAAERSRRLGMRRARAVAERGALRQRQVRRRAVRRIAAAESTREARRVRRHAKRRIANLELRIETRIREVRREVRDRYRADVAGCDALFG